MSKRYKLTQEQLGVYLESIRNLNSDMMNTSMTVSGEGSLDVIRFYQACRWSVIHLDALRGYLVKSQTGELPEFCILDIEELPVALKQNENIWEEIFHYSDISKTTGVDRLAEAKKAISENARQSFNLYRYPLYRYCVVRYDHNKYMISIALHHLICDGHTGILGNSLMHLHYQHGKLLEIAHRVFEFFSAIQRQFSWFAHLDLMSHNVNKNILLRQSAAVLQKIKDTCFQTIDNRLSRLPMLKTWDDYHAFLLQNQSEEKQNAAKEYWLNRLKDAHFDIDFHLPSFHGIESGQKSKEVYFDFSCEKLKKFNAFLRQHHFTRFVFMSALFNILLYEYTANDDITLSYVANVRPKGFQLSSGLFVNQLLLRTQINPQDSMLQLIKSIAENRNVERHYAHFDFFELKKLLSEKKSNPFSEKINVRIASTFFGRDSFSFCSLKTKAYSILPEEQVEKLAFLYDYDEKAQTLKCAFRYHAALFSEPFMQRMFVHFNRLLEVVMGQPEEKIETLVLLGKDEIEQQVTIWNRTPFDGVSHNYLVPNKLQQIIKQHPNRLAIISEAEALTYQSLEQRINKIASWLTSAHQRGRTVPIYCERSIHYVVAFFGILKAGAACAIIDRNLSKTIIQQRLNCIKANCILIDTEESLKQFQDNKFDPNIEVGCIEKIIRQPYKKLQYKFKNNKKISESDRAYVVYTSGSTGAPKAISVAHHTLSNLIRWEHLQERCDSKCTIYRVAHYAALGFDVSLQEICYTLLKGGQLYIVPQKTRHDLQKLMAFIAFYRIQKIYLPTLMLDRFAYTALENLSLKTLDSLQVIVIAGELLTLTSVISTFFERYPHITLENHYGPAETHVVTATRLSRHDLSYFAEYPNIGRPIANTQVFILSKHKKLLPVGVIGEIYIGGEHVKGIYLPNTKLTIPVRLGDKDYALYPTGDLGFFRDNGDIVYCGRKDKQVKIKGYRVLISAVEGTLRKLNTIIDARVVASTTSLGSKKLIAYIVLKKLIANNDEYETDIKSFLFDKLPEYMVPSNYIFVKELPLNRHGKLDLQKLDMHTTILDNKLTNISQVEAQLMRIWSEVLNEPITKINSSSDFFELGGNSLQAIILLEEIHKHISKKILLEDVYQNKVLAQLSDRIETLKKQNADDASIVNSQVQKLKYTMQEDMQLANELPVLASRDFKTDRAHYLLTGASGYLGSHLLEMLLSIKAVVAIYCLIRAKNTDHASKKLQDALTRYELKDLHNQHKIIPIAGDFSKIQLGLNNKDFDNLTKNVDAIIHCGAEVNHVYDYQTLRFANVFGTYHLLRLALSGIPKAFFFISTAGVITRDEDNHENWDDTDKSYLPLDATGYVQSKFVSEQLVKQAASNKGLSAVILRPGIIAPFSSVEAASLNHFMLWLKGCFQLRNLPDETNIYPLEVSPVKTVAMAIIMLIQTEANFSTVYHLSNPLPLTTKLLQLFLEEITHKKIDIVPVRQWLAELKTVGTDHPFFIFKKQYEVALEKQQSPRSAYQTSETQRALKRLGVSYPKNYSFFRKEIKVLHDNSFLISQENSQYDVATIN